MPFQPTATRQPDGRRVAELADAGGQGPQQDLAVVADDGAAPG
jgi:hypothetical protein